MTLAIHKEENVLIEIANTQKICDQLMKSPHYEKMGSSGIFAIVQKAKSIGMEPLDALNGGMYFVQGKVEMSGQSMLALIRSKGHSVSMDPKSTDTCVIMYGKRSDNGDTWKVQFSIEDAKRQGIYRNQWEKMPKVMCMWRCVSQLSRFLFSDIIKGCYVQGEISDAVPFDAPVNYKSKPEEKRIEISEIKPKIAEEQANEIKMILDECEPRYRSWVFESLEKMYGIIDLSDIPSEMFQRIKDAAIKNMDANHAKQKSEQQPELMLAEVQ